MIKIDDSVFRSRVKELKNLPEEILKDGLQTWKSETPVRSGNAKRKTRLNGDTIIADYSYAGALDSGSSKQASKGMSEPTLKQMQSFTDNFTRKI